MSLFRTRMESEVHEKNMVFLLDLELQNALVTDTRQNKSIFKITFPTENFLKISSYWYGNKSNEMWDMHFYHSLVSSASRALIIYYQSALFANMKSWFMYLFLHK